MSNQGSQPSDEKVGATSDEAPLEEGVDYYFENGLMVFTAHFLKRRGYCCESGCRHCPYGYERKEDPK